ncbi:magnesium and cobalt transport protein CorA [Chitinophagaceae bacterium IBVUCB1]|nr:magnesium and cobalt transport protein CorA [Chitinophagaceae bacterium IBVUCB1]
MSARNRVRGLAKLLPEWAWNRTKRRPMTSYNPAKETDGRDAHTASAYTVFDYDATTFVEKKLPDQHACHPYLDSGKITWINVDGLNKNEIEKLCNHYGIHQLVLEDILSIGQRAKMDEIDNVIFCLLPMLYYNDDTGQVETEQVSIVLGKNFVISFQEDPQRDVFDPVRERIKTANSKLRHRQADYLCYSLIDTIVDSYFHVIDKVNERIERLEDTLLLQKERAALEKISILRREIILIRRSISPVRDLVNGFLFSENPLLDERHDKYYKDVLDHITQANEYVENHREMVMNLQDLSMSQINLRMNEVMKVFTLLATLMAPATVIGGIFGMNFDVIPLAHQKDGFYITVAIMLVVPLVMMIWFKRKGWF